MSQLADIFFVRTWWTADVIRRDMETLLRIRSGPRVVVLWRSTLELFNECVEPTRRLRPAVGDRFVVCGPSVEETLIATATGIASDGAIGVSLSSPLAPTTASVQLLEYATTRPARRKVRKPRRDAACEQ